MTRNEMMESFGVSESEANLMEDKARDAYGPVVRKSNRDKEPEDQLVAVVIATMAPVRRWELLPKWFVTHFLGEKFAKRHSDIDSEAGRIQALARRLRHKVTPGYDF